MTESNRLYGLFGLIGLLAFLAFIAFLAWKASRETPILTTADIERAREIVRRAER